MTKNLGWVKYLVTSEVPQGSVLGPLRWNVMYDQVLRIKLPRQATFIGYPDDMAIIVVDKHLENGVQACEMG